MPRIARIVYSDYPHHVIQRGNNRQAVFFDDTDRKFYLALLKKYANECGCKVKAYCLMNNHVHILLIPKRNDTLARAMQKLSLTFTQYINKKYKRTGRLWECRFHSSPIDTETYLWAVCRYIEKNPVRAKVVEKPADYQWSSAKANTSVDFQDKIVEPVWKDFMNAAEYKKFLNQIDDEEQVKNIRNFTRKGMPIGPDSFIKSISEHLGLTFEVRPRGRPRKK
ncbi:MAG: transposase [Candidatus Omnitrophota bacterium]